MKHIIIRSLSALLVASVLPAAADEQSDFSAVPPATWQRFDPLALIGQNLATFDFTGGNCRLASPAPSAALIQIYQFGAAPRLVIFAPQTFTASVSSVNLISWKPTTSRSVDGSFLSVFTRCQDPAGFGTVNAYSAAVEVLPSNRAVLRLYRISNEFPQLIDSSPQFDFVPAVAYRLTLQSEGSVHTGMLHNLDSPASPVARIQAVDNTLVQGRCGFGLVTDQATPIDATFDDFLAWDGRLAALAAERVAGQSTLRVTSPLFRSLIGRIETSGTLGGPENPWLPVESAIVSREENELVITVPVAGPARFFQLKSN